MRWMARGVVGALGLSLGVVVHRHLFAGEVLAGRDVFRIFIPESHELWRRWMDGELALWTSSVRLGQPFLATLYAQVLYPLRVLPVLLCGPIWGMTVSQLLHEVLAGVGTYFAARRFGCRRAGAAVAGLSAACAPLFVKLAHYPNIAHAVAWAGLLVGLSRWLSTRPGAARACALASACALAFFAGSPETLLWQGSLMVAAGLGVRRPGRGLRWVLGALTLGGAMAAVVAVPGVELVLQSKATGSRLSDQLHWSLSGHQLLSLVVPLADLPRGSYWGSDQWMFPTVFLGSVVGALALLGLGRRRKVWTLALGVALLAVLALGEHLALSRWLHGAPVLSWFRYPVKFAPGAAFGLLLLAGLGVGRVSAWARRRGGAPLVRALWTWAVVVAAVWGLAKVSVLRSGAATGLGWAAVGSLGIVAGWRLLPGRPSVRAARVGWSLLLLVAGELLAASALFPPAGLASAEALARPSRLAAEVRSGGWGRLSAPLVDPEATDARQFIEHSREALVPLRFMEEGLSAIDGYGGREPAPVAAFFGTHARLAYDLAGVSHYLRWGPPPFPDLEEIGQAATGARLYRSATAFPRAFFVHQAIVLSDEEFLAALARGALDVRNVAYLAAPAQAVPAAAEVEPGCVEQVSWKEPSPERLELDVTACRAGHLVVTDRHFPGWEARVNGQAVLLERADVLVRAVALPRGRHQVVMTYAPRSFVVGAWVSAVAWIVALGVLGRSATQRLFGKKTSSPR